MAGEDAGSENGHTSPSSVIDPRPAAAARSFETFEHALGAEFGTELWKYVQPASAARGEIIVRAGRAHSTLYLLQHGRISVYGTREDGTFKRVRAINPGAFVNEEALFLDLPAAHTVIANTNCHMLALTRARFAELEAEDPKMAFEIQRTVLHHATVRQRKLERELNQLKGREAHELLRPCCQYHGQLESLLATQRELGQEVLSLRQT